MEAKIAEGLEKLKEEVNLLYFLEKDVSSIKKEMDEVKKLREELEKEKMAKEKTKAKLKKIQSAALTVIIASLLVGAVFTFVSCDNLFPSFETIVGDGEEDVTPPDDNQNKDNQADTEKEENKTENSVLLSLGGTKWQITEITADTKYVILTISEDGLVEAIDLNNSAYQGTIDESAITIKDIKYSYSLSDGNLILDNTISYKVIT